MLKEEAIKKIQELTQRFSEHVEEYKTSRYNETQTRIDYINPFFKALGWDIDNEQGTAESYRDVIHEDKVVVEDQTKAPDYCFTVYGQKKFYVEAKKPSVYIKDAIAPAYQIRRYGWSAKLPIGIITDFEEFAVYDCTRKPFPDDKPSVARVRYLTYKEYLTEFDFLWDTFSKEMVLKGSFDKFTGSSDTKKGTATVDKEFLNSMDGWRIELAKNVAVNNPKLSEEELNHVVQLTIDRIIFLRICEDKKIELYGKLKNSLLKEDHYRNVLIYFHEADSKYNSGLFDFAKDTLSLKVKIDDKAIKDIVNNLYYPHSPYVFSEIPVEILGNVYEQFLGKVIRLTSGHQAKVEEKPEVRKAGGVYYTPKYIVDYIVQNTVGELVKDKTPVEVSKMRILDPACGSGSFLLGAYQYLLNWHFTYYAQNKPEGKKNNPLTPDGRLSTAEKKRILLNNIYGVDIDQQAVEVTKLSLLLKALEGETNASINQQMEMFHERVLPSLENNIKCGNSLIGSDFYDDKDLGLFDKHEMHHINTMDWDKAFPEVFKAGGFDAVIGNPPYYNIQSLGAKSSEAAYIMKTYKEIWMDKSDILFYFIAKAIKLSKGYVSFIVSNAFLFADKAQNLRNYILENAVVTEIVNFEQFTVFQDASITTSIIKLSKFNKDNKTRAIVFSEKKYYINDIVQYLNNNSKLAFSVKLKKNEVFALIDDRISDLNLKIDNIHKKLGEILFVGKGMETAANEVFLFNNKPKNFPERQIKFRMSGEIINRYYSGAAIEYLLYFEDIDSFEKLPLIIREHLNKNKIVLKNRATVKNEGHNWWKYSRPLHKAYYQLPKIWCSYRSKNNAFTLDETGQFIGLTNTTVIFGTNEKISLKYILALLNSKVINFRYKTIGKQTGAGIFEYFENQVSKLPIPLPETTKYLNSYPQMYSQISEKTISLVDQMLETQKLLHNSKTDSDKAHYQQKVDILDQQIDKLVYELYGLTKEEIKIVEGKK